jgi:hypothetical protein
VAKIYILTSARAPFVIKRYLAAHGGCDPKCFGPNGLAALAHNAKYSAGTGRTRVGHFTSHSSPTAVHISQLPFFSTMRATTPRKKPQRAPCVAPKVRGSCILKPSTNETNCSRKAALLNSISSCSWADGVPLHGSVTNRREETNGLTFHW